MSQYNSYILPMDIILTYYPFKLLSGCSSSCSHRGTTYRFCCMVAETISVICSEHSYQQSAPDLALMLPTCL